MATSSENRNSSIRQRGCSRNLMSRIPTMLDADIEGSRPRAYRHRPRRRRASTAATHSRRTPLLEKSRAALRRPSSATTSQQHPDNRPLLYTIQRHEPRRRSQAVGLVFSGSTGDRFRAPTSCLGVPLNRRLTRGEATQPTTRRRLRDHLSPGRHPTPASHRRRKRGLTAGLARVCAHVAPLNGMQPAQRSARTHGNADFRSFECGRPPRPPTASSLRLSISWGIQLQVTAVPG